MHKLKTEMEKARSIMDLVKKRDRLKKESLLLDFLIFDKKAEIWELRRIYQIPASGDSDQATELKKVPKFKPKPSPVPPSQAQHKIQIKIDAGVVRTITSESAYDDPLPSPPLPCNPHPPFIFFSLSLSSF